MDKLSIYEYAKKNIVDYTGKDSTANLLKEYAFYGMYNLLTTLNDIGGSVENTKLIALPDFTYSKNEFRWRAGYPYGSIISIDSHGIPFLPLGFRPNCCGITMCKIDKNNAEPQKIMQKVADLSSLKLDISDDDLKRGNHFIGIYYDEKYEQYYAIIHGSFSFVKSGYHNLPGLYIDKTNYWDRKKKTFRTEFTSFDYLIDEDALEYYSVFKEFEKITKTNREKITHFLFDNCETIMNETHEGLYDSHTIVLGAYVMDKPFSCPIMLSAEKDLPIINVNRTIDGLNRKIYACPHGGGYSLTDIKEAHYNSDNNKYELTYSNNAKMFTSDIRNLIHKYRTNTDVLWTKEFNYGDYKSILKTQYNFKL